MSSTAVGPKRLADLLRHAIAKHNSETPADRAARIAALEAQEAAQRARHASLQRETWPSHLRACNAPQRAAEALRNEMPKTTPALTAVREWMDSGKAFLVLSGNTGTGKTVAGCWALRLATRAETRTGMSLPEWDDTRGFFIRFSELGRLSNFEEGDRATWHRARFCRVLVLDEVGGAVGEELPARLQELLEELVDARDAEGRRTVITTNLSVVRKDGVASEFARFVKARAQSRIGRSCTVRDCGTRDMRREVTP